MKKDNWQKKKNHWPKRIMLKSAQNEEWRDNPVI